MAQRLERRKGPDLWMRSLTWAAVVGWVLMIAALWLTAEAKPEVETFFERYHKIRLRQHWDMSLARYILYLMFPGLLLGYGGLLLNLFRHRRRNDEIRVSLVLLALMATVGTVLCLAYL